MSAREQYPALASFATSRGVVRDSPELQAVWALDEIDRLRALVDGLTAARDTATQDADSERQAHLRGDGPCSDCGGPNVMWYTDDLLWNRVVRDHGDEAILCVHCFIARAENYYDVQCWKLSIAPVLSEWVIPRSELVEAVSDD